MKPFKNGAEVAAAFIALRESKGLSIDEVAERLMVIRYPTANDVLLLTCRCEVRGIEEDFCGPVEFIRRWPTLVPLLEAVRATRVETDEFLVRCGVVPKDVIEILLAKPEMLSMVRVEATAHNDLRKRVVLLRDALLWVRVVGHEHNCPMSGPAYMCSCKSQIAKRANDALKGVGET